MHEGFCAKITNNKEWIKILYENIILAIYQQGKDKECLKGWVLLLLVFHEQFCCQ
jgi:hypothetical protein